MLNNILAVIKNAYMNREDSQAVHSLFAVTKPKQATSFLIYGKYNDNRFNGKFESAPCKKPKIIKAFATSERIIWK